MKRNRIRRVKRISDAKANYIIARRRYIDARRRYIDDELAPGASKLSSLCNKAASALKKFATDHPSIAKVIRILLKIDSVVGALLNTANVALVAVQLKVLCTQGKSVVEEAKAAGMMDPRLRVALNIAITAFNFGLSFAKIKLANALTPEA